MKAIILTFVIFLALNVSAGWVFNPILKMWYNTETGELSVVGEDDEDDDFGSVMVHNNIGNKVASSMQKPDEANKTVVIKTDGLPNGIYFVTVFSKDETKFVTKKLIVGKQ
jgi:hypothetical protein